MNSLEPDVVLESISTMEVKDGDVIKLVGDFPTHFLQQISDCLSRRDSFKGLFLIVLKPGETMETLSVDKMRDLGWVRA